MTHVVDVPARLGVVRIVLASVGTLRVDAVVALRAAKIDEGAFTAVRDVLVVSRNVLLDRGLVRGGELLRAGLLPECFERLEQPVPRFASGRPSRGQVLLS